MSDKTSMRDRTSIRDRKGIRDISDVRLISDKKDRYEGLGLWEMIMAFIRLPRSPFPHSKFPEFISGET